ncbi:MAG: siderophore-interacting protein [Proteobacteria bacterium]|nr:MAG: siderophore-interacting protein [Pseudomonadota bacterium]
MIGSHRELISVVHELKRRELAVKRIEDLNPSLRRVTLSGDALADFTSLSPDDHVKVFFPDPDNPEKPAMRDYTPRRFDQASRELDLEFVLHGDGPGSSWAARAQVGDILSVGGPRGSKVVPYHFDWYLMIGDESSLPSFARRLAELPAGARAVALLEVENVDRKLPLPTLGEVEVHWVFRGSDAPGNPRALSEALGRLSFPKGDYYAWVKHEKSCAMALKQKLIEAHGANDAWIKATGYWALRQSS